MSDGRTYRFYEALKIFFLCVYVWVWVFVWMCVDVALKQVNSFLKKMSKDDIAKIRLKSFLSYLEEKLLCFAFEEKL